MILMYRTLFTVHYSLLDDILLRYDANLLRQ